MAETKDIYQSLLNEICEQYDSEIVIDFFDQQKKSIDVIDSGSISINHALGINGYPKGRIVEIYGNESCGKTTLALQAANQVIKNNEFCAYLDLECALDKQYVCKNVCDPKKLIVLQPQNAEQTFDLIEKIVKTNKVRLIIVDSVAAMIPKIELDGEMSDQTIGVHARIMSKGLRIIQPLLTKHNVCLIFINQIREKIGVCFGNNETTPGGRALRFYASIRLELRKSELIKNNDNIVGLKTCVKVVKNKLSPPLLKAYVDIFFDKGFDPKYEIVQIAINKNVIVKKGG
jgi:recombination protein RecA